MCGPHRPHRESDGWWRRGLSSSDEGQAVQDNEHRAGAGVVGVGGVERHRVGPGSKGGVCPPSRALNAGTDSSWLWAFMTLVGAGIGFMGRNA